MLVLRMLVPFLSIAPARLTPVVLTCEHASHRLPGRVRLRREEREILVSHWGWDIGAWSLTRELARRLGTSAVGGRWSRLFIDLNRRVDDPTLIRSSVEGVDLSWNAGIDAEDVDRRVQLYHAEYHVEVDRLIARRLVRKIRPLLFAVHTFTPVFDGRRRRFDLGILYERDREAAHCLGQTIRPEGFIVRYNQPYSGMAGMMYSVDRHGAHHGLTCLEIEVNHDLFQRPDAASQLASVITRGIQRLVADA